MTKWMIVFFTALIVAVDLPAQQQGSSEDLKQQQSQLQREIDDLRSTLKDSKKHTSAGLAQLEMVQERLRLREKAIRSINQQISMLEGNIGRSKTEIDSLRERLDTLKVQYARNIVYAYKLRSNYDFLNFIFSAPSFNDAVRRIHYFRSYHQYCEDQALTIRNTRLQLQGKISGLELTRREKDAAAQKQEMQKSALEEEKRAKNAVVKTLKSKEKEIAKELTAKKKADYKLRLAIQKAIQGVITKDNNTLTATNTATGKKEVKTNPLETTPEGIRLSGNFENNKGRLPWPVDKAFIKLHFGRNHIGELMTNNPGLTIETEPGAVVKAVFEGEVVRIFDIEGAWTVLVRHGKYFTVYSNLRSVSVSRNQKVDGGQAVGIVANNDAGNGEIDFIIMEERTNVDPEKWIRKR
jgi:septal ring factor EnvC (AmiA/AmiB activator)